MNESSLWGLIRPYITPVRVAAFLAVILGPPFALLIGKLAVVLASWGYHIDATKATVIFGAATTVVGGMIASALKNYIDNRTHFEAALISAGKENLIQGKALNAPSKDGAHVLSEDADIAETDADPPEFPERRERDELGGRE